MPRSGWEPWGIFRKPYEGRVQDNLRKWKTGGFRRISEDAPFSAVILSSPTRSDERQIAPHPSLKPQAFMRQIVSASLPLGRGVVLDPFMGGGSTIAAAVAVGYESIGVEADPTFFKMAERAIPPLAQLSTGTNGRRSLPDERESLMPKRVTEAERTLSESRMRNERYPAPLSIMPALQPYLADALRS